MKTCATRTYLATPAEHLLVLLLIELTLYVRPCAMEMPALLAALLQDAGAQHHHMPYEQFPDALLSPPAAALPAAVAPVDATAAMNVLNEEQRQELLSEALEIKHAEKNEAVDFDGILPPVMATAGVPLKEAGLSLSAAAAAPARHCLIEITTKVPGTCQNMPRAMGSACVAGDYMDIFNMDCMNGGF